LAEESAKEPSAKEPSAKEKMQAKFGANISSSNDASDDDDDEELELWRGRYSPKAMYGTWIMLAIASVAVIVACISIGLSNWFWFIPLVIAWGYFGGLFVFRRLNASYELTNQRLIHRAGILSRKTDRIEVIDMDDVNFQQSLLERPFGVGSITITSSDTSHPHLHIAGIDNVVEVSDMMDKARRKERIRRGIHIEAV